MKVRNSEEHNKRPFKRPFKGRFLFTMSTEGNLVEFHKVNYFVETPASLLVNKHFFSTRLRHFTGVFFSRKMGFQPLPRSPQPLPHEHERISKTTYPT